MPARVSEAFVLRTYPLKEADLVVSFLARDQGVLRGVARRARKPKSSFGSGLERLSQVRMSYFQSETRELVNLDSCELMQSQFALASDYTASVALDYFAEVTEQLLPAAEPNERYYRLLQAVLDHLRAAPAEHVWRAATYFGLWAVRLSGFLPDLDACLGCGVWLKEPEAKAWFARSRAGLVCSECRGALGLRDSWELAGISRSLVDNMLRLPITEIRREGWPRESAADLRRFLFQQIEAHIERKLATASVLETL